MAKSIGEFVEDLKRDADKFELFYRAKMVETPICYPESIEPDNEWAWMEFFTVFCDEIKEPSEQALDVTITAAATDYTVALRALTGLRTAVDALFNSVHATQGKVRLP